jgi:glycosyltransferase involved in cell wall biosynthesis
MGTVPDLRPYLQKATVAVAPLLYGAGIQNKVLEAMACGTPVVASAQAAAALAVEHNCDLLLAADTETFATAVLRLFANPHEGKELGTRGRLYVEANHAWHMSAQQLEAVYHAALAEMDK